MLSTMRAPAFCGLVLALGVAEVALGQGFDPSAAYCQYDHSTLNERAFDEAYANNATDQLKLVVVVRAPPPRGGGSLG